MGGEVEGGSLYPDTGGGFYGVLWLGEGEEEAEVPVLCLLKNTFSSFSLIPLYLELSDVTVLIPSHTSVTLLCWGLFSSFLRYASLLSLS